jgi:hypothetical protein
LLALNWLSLALLNPNTGGNVFMLGYFVGSLFAHPTLAAAWAAFGPGRLAWRVPLSFAWAISLAIALAINFALYGGPNDAFIVVGGCLLGQWLALQLPLWALVLGRGLHLRYSEDAEGESNAGSMQFGIRHLLAVMLIVGVVLGIGRIAAIRVSIAGMMAPIFAFLAGAAIVLTLPLLLAALMRRMAVLGVLLTLLFTGFATAWETPILSRLGGGSGPQARDFVAINIGSAAFILASALVVRLNGYCLYTKAEKVL